MRLTVDKITDINKSYERDFEAGELNRLLRPSDENTPGPFCDPIRVRFEVSRLKKRVLLEGELEARLSLECGHCLQGYPGQIRDHFSQVLNLDFSPQAEIKEELELDEEQINMVPVVDGELDLKPVLLEQFLIRLPLYPCCKEDCAGLCPHCGADLNKTECGCEPVPFNNRFGKLKDLKID